MNIETDDTIIGKYRELIGNSEFPCVAARAALNKNQIRCIVADHMACPASDKKILDFLYDFVDNYRQTDQTYQSAAVIFRQPTVIDEILFDSMLWQRLEAIRRIDEQNYRHDPRVDNDPQSSEYSFSLKEEAFFVLGLHPGSRRNSRQFSYPTLVFNPHQQFEILRQRDQYGKLKNIVRKRDLSFSGSINPMLDDFGKASEVYQYSGLEHSSDWTCPLKKKYA